MLRQMIVAVDFSVWSRHAAQHACDLSRAIGGRLTLLHVLEEHDSGPPHRKSAQSLLQHLSLLARRPPNCLIVPALFSVNGFNLEGDGLNDGSGLENGVAPAILAVAEGLDAELIVIGLHGQGGSSANTLGRVVQQVLLGTRIPVQVVAASSDRQGTGRWSAALAER